MKKKKISSCKKIYESFINFTDDNTKKISFKIYKDADIGLEKEHFNKILKINVI
jgi:hypothetical protein